MRAIGRADELSAGKVSLVIDMMTSNPRFLSALQKAIAPQPAVSIGPSGIGGEYQKEWP